MLHFEQKCAYISVLDGAWWDMEQVHYGICEIGLFFGSESIWMAHGSSKSKVRTAVP